MFPNYPYQIQSLYPQPQIPQISQVAHPIQNIQYVNGKQSAETYQMPANSSVILMDSNTNRFYLKQTDASGTATIRTYDFTESEDDKPTEYVTKSEFEAFKSKLKGDRKHESSNGTRKQHNDNASNGGNDEGGKP